MNRILKIGAAMSFLTLSVALLTLYATWAFWQQSYPREFKIYIPGRVESESLTGILNCSLPAVQNEVPLLRIVPHYISEVEGLTLAREVFGMTGDLQITRGVKPWSDMGFGVVNETWTLMFWYSGVIEYYAEGSQEISAGPLPSFAEAKDIADAFLQKLDEHSLIPKSPLIQMEFLETDYSAYYGIGGVTQPILISVFYPVEYQGKPFVGSAGVNVEVGGSGTIFRFSGKWRNVESDGSIKITISPEEALNNLGSNIPVGTGEVKTVTVTKVELGYFLEAQVEQQEEITPIYRFDMLINGERTLIYMPATNAPTP